MSAAMSAAAAAIAASSSINAQQAAENTVEAGCWISKLQPGTDAVAYATTLSDDPFRPSVSAITPSLCARRSPHQRCVARESQVRARHLLAAAIDDG